MECEIIVDITPGDIMVQYRYRDSKVESDKIDMKRVRVGNVLKPQ